MPSTSGDASDHVLTADQSKQFVSMPSTSGDASDMTIVDGLVTTTVWFQCPQHRAMHLTYAVGNIGFATAVSMPSTSGDASDPTTRKSQQRKAFDSRFRARSLFLSSRTSLGMYRHEKTMSELSKE